MAGLEQPPRVLVCASAIGYYGNRGDEPLTERSAAGSGFLADVVREWEAATRPAAEAGIRVVNLRFGIVLSPRRWSARQMLTPFKLGVGGPFGSGRQYMSWIAIDDVVGAILHALVTTRLSRRPSTRPHPSPSPTREFSKTLGRVLRRPSVVRGSGAGSAAAVRRVLRGGLLEASACCRRRLLESGYHFRYPLLEAALRHLLGRPA